MAKKPAGTPVLKVRKQQNSKKPAIVPVSATNGANVESHPGEISNQTKKAAPIVPPKTTKGTQKVKSARGKTRQDPIKPDPEPIPAAGKDDPPVRPAHIRPLEELPARWQLFIAEFAIDKVQSKAAIRAGYSAHSAIDIGSELAARPEIRYYLDLIIADQAEEVRLSRARILSEIEAAISVDMNELVEHRRVCCRYCHGVDFGYMETKGELRERKRLHDLETAKAKLLDKDLPDWDDSRQLGFIGNKDPHPDCPECFGEGVGDVFLKDTRFLSRRARMVYTGTEIGKDGIKIKTVLKEKMLDMMGKHHKIFEADGAGSVNVIVLQELEDFYANANQQTAAGEAVKGRGDRLRKEFDDKGGNA